MAKNNRTHPNKPRIDKVADFHEFARFTAYPRAVRRKEFQIKTDGEFAKRYELHPSTLVEWKKRDDFWEEVRILWKRWGRNRLPDVLLGLYTRASGKGDAAAAKVFMQAIEEFKETGVVEHSFEQTTLEKIQKNVRIIIESEKKKSNARKHVSKKATNKKG